MQKTLLRQLPVAIGVALVGLPLGAHGETMSALPEKTRPEIRLGATQAALAAWWENDFKWSDKYYTNANKFAYTSPELFSADTAPAFFQNLATVTPLASPTGGDPGAYRFHLGLAQEIYTAKDEYIANPPLGDHPYAGLLYGTLGLSSETAARLDSLEISLGVIGPSSLAKQVQNNWHHFIDDPIVGGWGNQLHDELLFQVAWERAWRIGLHQEESFALDVLPRIHTEVGTVKNYATAGAQLRLGWNLPRDFGVNFLRSSAATTRPDRSMDYSAALRWKPDTFYVFADLQGEGWLRNSILDGNLWHDSRDVDRRPWVAQASAGIAAHWGPWKLTVSQVVRSKEFGTQDHSVFVFSSFNIGVVF